MDIVAQLNHLSCNRLPGLMGVTIVKAGSGQLISELEVRPELLAPNGYLHAATVIALADTSCGYGTRLHLNEDEKFTTVELKSNFISTAREGLIYCTAKPAHIGRSTHIWDARVTDQEGKTIALFRCTQMILRAEQLS